MTFKVFCVALGGSRDESETITAITHRGAVYDWCTRRFQRDAAFANIVDGYQVNVLCVESREEKILQVTVRSVPEWIFKEMP